MESSGCAYRFSAEASRRKGPDGSECVALTGRSMPKILFQSEKAFVDFVDGVCLPL